MGFGICLKWARKLETDAGSVRNDFWAVLRGWLKGYTVCGVVGWATGEREGDRDCLKSSLRAVLMEDGISYTKGGLSEEFAGSCVCWCCSSVTCLVGGGGELVAQNQSVGKERACEKERRRWSWCPHLFATCKPLQQLHKSQMRSTMQGHIPLV